MNSIITITLIVSGLALALAIWVTVLLLLGMRKVSKTMTDIQSKLDAQKASPLQLLVDKYAEGDFEEQPTATQQPSPTTQFVDTGFQPSEKGDNSQRPSLNDTALQMANDVFLPQYKALTEGLDEHNYKERAPQMARLLIEMGLWLKDFLPVSQQEFNVTKTQRDNVASIGLPDELRQQRLAEAPLPTGNAYDTPFEVIALDHILQQWGVDDLALLISGYRYKKG